MLSIRLNPPEGVEIDSAFQQFLDEILPETDERFERLFIRRVQRYGNPTTQYHVSRQISRFFTGARAYRVAASVVMAYKAAELKSELLQHQALGEIEANLAAIQECEITKHPRTNRSHLLASALCARWHLFLALGKREDFLASLEQSVALSTGLDDYYTVSYNVSFSMLMLALYHIASGKQEAVKPLAQSGYRMFRAAVADSFYHPTFFRELEVSHRNIANIMEIARKPELDRESLHRLLRGALRTSKEISDVMISNFESIAAESRG